MKIDVHFPQVMKMVMISTIDVPDSANLKEIKEKVFESFWEIFSKTFPSLKQRHGTRDDIAIQDQDIEITSDDALRERLKESANFQAIFKTHLLHPKRGEK